MNDERDPVLEALFADAEQELVDDAYTSQVMDRIGQRCRNVMAGRLAIVAFIVAFEFLLNAPVQSSIGVITEALGTDLISLEEGWISTVVEPINNVAGLLGALFLGLLSLYKRVMH